MYLETAVKAAREAEKIVMGYFNKEKQIRHKGEIDLVTAADVESEKKIMSVIREKYPSHGFITEEEGSFNEKAEYVWIIDPIDGTTSFSHNYPMFSISIALYRRMKPVAGVVLAPYLRELFTAEAGKGAFMNREKIQVSKNDKLVDSLIVTGFPYTRLTSDVDNLKNFCRVAKKAGELRRSGSAALDICYIAAGRCDGYWEMSLKIMDTAAACLICKEAGGKVTDFRGKEIDKDFTRIVATNGIIHEKLRELLEE